MPTFILYLKILKIEAPLVEGHEIAVSATGEDATEALTALQELIGSGFDESTITSSSAATRKSKVTHSKAARTRRRFVG